MFFNIIVALHCWISNLLIVLLNNSSDSNRFLIPHTSSNNIIYKVIHDLDAVKDGHCESDGMSAHYTQFAFIEKFFHDSNNFTLVSAHQYRSVWKCRYIVLYLGYVSPYYLLTITDLFESVETLCYIWSMPYDRCASAHYVS